MCLFIKWETNNFLEYFIALRLKRWCVQGVSSSLMCCRHYNNGRQDMEKEEDVEEDKCGKRK